MRVGGLRSLLISGPNQCRLLRTTKATIRQPGGGLYPRLRALTLAPEHPEHVIDQLLPVTGLLADPAHQTLGPAAEVSGDPFRERPAYGAWSCVLNELRPEIACHGYGGANVHRDISQEISPNEADRFRFTVGVGSPVLEPRVYQLEVFLYYDQRGDRRLRNLDLAQFVAKTIERVFGAVQEPVVCPPELLVGPLERLLGRFDLVMAARL
jgi:hypothetical protein